MCIAPSIADNCVSWILDAYIATSSDIRGFAVYVLCLRNIKKPTRKFEISTISLHHLYASSTNLSEGAADILLNILEMLTESQQDLYQISTQSRQNHDTVSTRSLQYFAAGSPSHSSSEMWSATEYLQTFKRNFHVYRQDGATICGTIRRSTCELLASAAGGGGYIIVSQGGEA